MSTLSGMQQILGSAAAIVVAAIPETCSPGEDVLFTLTKFF